jgi:enolase
MIPRDGGLEIADVVARKVLNSAGDFTVEIQVELGSGMRGVASAIARAMKSC